MGGNPNIQRAYESMLNDDFEQAIECFEQAIADEPDNASYHYRLSISFARSNKLTKALEHAEEACQLDPTSEPYRLHLNTVLARVWMHKADQLLKEFESSRLDEAISALIRAVRLDTLSVEALLMLAVAYEEAGRFAEALTAVEEAVRLEPQHKEANELLEQFKIRVIQ